MLIKEMLDNHAAEVLWLDCGDRIVRPTALPKIFNVIRALGFVSESSVRTTKRWVHPLMLKYLGAEGLDVTNCNGALVGRVSCWISSVAPAAAKADGACACQ